MVRLYPPRFRAEYGEDLAAFFDELIEERGRAVAWRICIVDLLVTLPRMHLERIMNPTRTPTALTWTIVLLAAGGVVSILTGIYPGAVLLVVAAVLGTAQRSALAQAVRVPSTEVRRRRFRSAALLASACIACYVVFLATIGDSWTGRETVLAVVGSTCMVAAVGYFVTALLTPRSPRLSANGA
jgi:peptidoglycan/LPS O-acetylase OafA/YrhL